MTYFKVWKIWAASNHNNVIYKLAVFLGFIKSPTFNMFKDAELLSSDFYKALKTERDELNIRYSSKLKACRDLHGGLMKDDLF